MDRRIKPVSGIRKCHSSSPGRDVTMAHFFGNPVNSAVGPAPLVVLPAFLWSMCSSPAPLCFYPGAICTCVQTDLPIPALSCQSVGWKELLSVTDSGPAWFYKLLKVSHKAWSILNCGGRKRICSQEF